MSYTYEEKMLQARLKELEGQNERLKLTLESHAMLIGDPEHPATLDYVATNILAHIDKLPNNGDWHGQLRNWAQRHSTGRLKPNG